MKKPTSTDEQPVQDHEPPPGAALPFFVAAVGASAGGREALQDLLRHLSPEGGCCFVVIQHLPFDFKSRLAELLGRETALSVREIEDGASPLPNCVHVVPAHGLVTLEEGRFRCRDREAGGALLPINVLLTSLAREQAARGVAVILSGAGSDGTQGARVLKEAGGLVLAQQPASARFDGMPSSVIRSGSVHFVGTPAQLAERIELYARRALQRLACADGEPEREREALAEMLRLASQQSAGHSSTAGADSRGRTGHAAQGR